MVDRKKKNPGNQHRNVAAAAGGAAAAIGQTATPRSSLAADPSQYTRRILLVVAGLSPQVVTETLYALNRENPARTPTELWIATTQAGLEKVREHLLPSGADQLGKLCRDYALPSLCFDESRVLCLRDSQGRVLDDVHGEESFLAMGDLVLQQLAEWTSDDRSAVHLSIAGGRKTMSYLAGHAMSILGRPQDRLSHVLVDPPFEQIPAFFYPTPRSRVVTWTAKDGREQNVDFAKARVRLAPVPFLRLRDVIPSVLRDQAMHLPFSEIVERAQRSLSNAVVEIDTHNLKLTCAGVPVTMTEEHFALYLTLAKRREEGITPRAEHDDDVAAYLHWYQHVLEGGTVSASRGYPLKRLQAKRDRWLPNGATTSGQARKTPPPGTVLQDRAAEFSEMVSRINKECLEPELGPHLAPRYLIVGVPPKKARQYFLPENLEVVFVDERPRKES